MCLLAVRCPSLPLAIDWNGRNIPSMEIMPNQVDYKKQFVFSKNHYFTFFARIKFFFFFFFFFFSSSSASHFSPLQTTKLNLNWPTTLRQPWTIWLAPTLRTLASVKTDVDDFLGRKMTPTT